MTPRYFCQRRGQSHPPFIVMPPPPPCGGAAGSRRSLAWNEDQDRDLRESQVVAERPTRLLTCPAEELDHGEEAIGADTYGVGRNSNWEGVTPPGEIVVFARFAGTLSTGKLRLE
jgi:hypothetical protein